ncbi:class I ribonucleotide reductase maintenance protein YfaE [Candidatus Blochmannia ocreatus (nom. nud.)]|uniref:Class I ribonucleotide reductase maintenance protein YfaE n=1 Tax=Candidatus Blochmannia ocreatus (nom. nud.) TaxID=251538 RepID=A0ABY4SYA8_9ENTR|nr:class I ribonucleotide reductase maintenance protein YfaE [Candidatus Blochmannia ocreatus]URJ24972.1 class I ribonucleotide reductase maintenance protein YfaE [Candidatus Blochmannia ocreatus]
MNLTIFNCKIIFSDKQRSLNIKFTHNSPHYSTLLEALEWNNIPTNYQCKSGYCGVCRIFLIHGQIKYKQEPLGYISPKEILSCCCIPVNNLIIKLKA